jgi:hypothetical protein
MQTVKADNNTVPKPVYSITPIIRTLVIRIANYPDWLGPSSNFVENYTKLICLEITGYRIRTVLYNVMAV